MSWYAEGRLHHNYDEYRAAQEREQAQRIKAELAQLRVASMDTSGTRAALAAQVAASRTAARRQRELDRALSDERASSASLARDTATARRAATDQLASIQAEVASIQQELSAALVGAEGRVEAQVARLSQGVEEELARAARANHVEREAAEADRAVARALLQGLDASQGRRLGVDLDGPTRLLAMAESSPPAIAVAQARKARSAVEAAAVTIDMRAATLQGYQASLGTELDRLEGLLAFSEEDREDLVGDLDASLKAALAAQRQRLSAIAEWETGRRSADRVEETLAQLAPHVEALHRLVVDFDALEARRKEAVSGLAQKLGRTFQEEVSLVAVDVPEQALQPVTARFTTTSGAQIDVDLDLDGCMRVHHHGHASVSACHRVAEGMSTRLDGLMERTSKANLDMVDPPTERRYEPLPGATMAGSRQQGGSR